jgi:hypothetical protein
MFVAEAFLDTFEKVANYARRACSGWRRNIIDADIV